MNSANGGNCRRENALAPGVARPQQVTDRAGFAFNSRCLQARSTPDGTAVRGPLPLSPLLGAVLERAKGRGQLCLACVVGPLGWGPLVVQVSDIESAPSFDQQLDNVSVACERCLVQRRRVRMGTLRIEAIRIFAQVE